MARWKVNGNVQSVRRGLRGIAKSHVARDAAGYDQSSCFVLLRLLRRCSDQGIDNGFLKTRCQIFDLLARSVTVRDRLDFVFAEVLCDGRFQSAKTEIWPSVRDLRTR